MKFTAHDKDATRLGQKPVSHQDIESGQPQQHSKPQQSIPGPHQADESFFEYASTTLPDTAERALEQAEELAATHSEAQFQLGVRQRGFIAGTSYTRVAARNVPYNNYYTMLAAAPDAMTQYIQLLIWCLNNRIERLEADSSYESKIKQDALLKLVLKLAKNEMAMDWSHAIPNVEDPAKKLAPNPVNKMNQREIARCTHLLREMQAEQEEWMQQLRELEKDPELSPGAAKPLQLPKLEIDCGEGATRVSAAIAELKYQFEKRESELHAYKLTLHDKTLLAGVEVLLEKDSAMDT